MLPSGAAKDHSVAKNVHDQWKLRQLELAPAASFVLLGQRHRRSALTRCECL